MTNTFFEVRNLNVALQKHRIVHEVSFSVASGEMLALVGPNGAGKSTLLRAIAGILRPESGSVFLNGQDIFRMSSRQRATQIAFCSQEEAPPADLRVAEVVALGRLPYRHGLPWTEKHDPKGAFRIQQALDDLQLAALADRPCSELSGGQRHRAVLARTLAQDTPLVFFDEPTNHVDIHHQLHLLQLLRASGKTVICSLHDLNLARQFCDSAIVLNKGRIHCAGKVAATLTPTTLAQVFQVEASLAADRRQQEHLLFEAPTNSSISSQSSQKG